MALKTYVITDREAISLILDDDIEGFRRYIEEDPYLDFGEASEFETEKEAVAFCAALGYGLDDRCAIERLPLRSFEAADRPL